jgi:hypothetical protein
MMSVMCESIKSCSECLQNQCKFLVFENTQVCVESGRSRWVAGAVSIIPKGNGILINVFLFIASSYIWLISGAETQGSLEPFNRQEGLGFQHQGSLPPQGMDRQRDRSRSVTPLDRHSRASSVASELSDVVEEEPEEYLPPRRRASPFHPSPIANRTRQR